MTHVSRNVLGDIADHYQTVIEGTGSYDGIPGTRARNPSLFEDEDTNIQAQSAGTTTSMTIQTGLIRDANDVALIQKDITAPFFLVCVSDSASSTNVDAARRISTLTTAGVTTFASAWPTSITTTQRFRLLRGFKRMPNGVDIEAEHANLGGGFDRFYMLDIMPADRLNWSGDGFGTYNATMRLRLRLLKYGDDTTTRQAMLENLMILRGVLNKGNLRPSSYVRAIFAPQTGPELVADDKEKLVMADTYRLVIRIDRTFN